MKEYLLFIHILRVFYFYFWCTIFRYSWRIKLRVISNNNKVLLCCVFMFLLMFVCVYKVSILILITMYAWGASSSIYTMHTQHSCHYCVFHFIINYFAKNIIFTPKHFHRANFRYFIQMGKIVYLKLFLLSI
jgi:hypothetical protein